MPHSSLENKNLNFPAHISKQLNQIFCSGEWFGMNVTKVKIPPEIKPPLKSSKPDMILTNHVLNIILVIKDIMIRSFVMSFNTYVNIWNLSGSEFRETWKVCMPMDRTENRQNAALCTLHWTELSLYIFEASFPTAWKMCRSWSTAVLRTRDKRETILKQWIPSRKIWHWHVVVYTISISQPRIALSRI